MAYERIHAFAKRGKGPLLDTAIRLETPEGAEVDVRPAGLVVRGMAFLIDELIRWGVIVFVMIFSGFLGGFGFGLGFVLAFLCYWLYPVIFELGRNGQTPGKKSFGIQVVHDDGTPIRLPASLLRNLLLREEAETLWLAQGLPRAWLEPGRHVAVRDAPTEFGKMSYRIDAEADGTIRIHIDPPSRRMPEEIRVRLRHPERRTIVSVSAAPTVRLEISEDTLSLRNLRVPVDLQVRFAAGTR